MTMLPLRERVSATPVVRPAATPDVTWRTTVGSDVGALHALMAAISAVDHPQWTETREDIAEELGHSWVDLDRDSLVAIDTATGDLVAHGLVVCPPNPETVVRAILVGGVHPEHRGSGIGRALLAWQHDRALERFASSDLPLPGWMMQFCEERVPGHARLFERAGFSRTRWFLGQERMLAHDIPEVAIPEGLRIVSYDDRWSSATLEAKNDAFRDHWGSQPVSEEQWESILSLPNFSAEHSFLAVTDADEVVGLLLTELPREDWVLQGYSSGFIPTVGVVSAWRRRGVAPALLARVFTSLRAAGIERVELDVDSDNPSGAVGLYTGMGFVETNRIVSMTKVY